MRFKISRSMSLFKIRISVHLQLTKKSWQQSQLNHNNNDLLNKFYLLDNSMRYIGSLAISILYHMHIRDCDLTNSLPCTVKTSRQKCESVLKNHAHLSMIGSDNT